MEDDEFEDSGFDDLNADLLATLETQALTQGQSQRRIALEPDSNVHAEVKQRPSSDYGFDDDDEEDEVIDVDAQRDRVNSVLGNVGQSRRAPAQRVSNYKDVKLPSDFGGPSGHQEDPPGDQDETDHMDLVKLQSRIAELEQQRSMLEKSAEDARSAVMSKSGEIAIVRSNHDKAVKEYERRMMELQRLHAEEVMKFKAELDASRKDREMVETSNKFLEHDLAQELERAKQARKAGKLPQPAKLVSRDQTSTPKKSAKPLPFRDGFDDDEVMIASPTKSRDRRGASTPKAGSKRKRLGLDMSPVKPLELSPAEGMLAPEASSHAPPRETLSIRLSPSSEKDKFEFMQQVVNHTAGSNRQRTLDILARHSIPGQSNGTVSSLIYDGFSTLSSAKNIGEFRQTFCQHVAAVWAQLLEKSFYAPLYELTDLLLCILITSPLVLSTELITLLVPLCCKTIDLIAFPTANKSRDSSIPAGISEDLKSKINVPHYFEMLIHLAGSCLFEEAPLTRFWSAVSFDFVLIMLHRSQPLQHITFMLELLCTSVLQTTFGPIDASNPLQQPRRESSLIDRHTVLLFETPEPQPNPVGKQGHSESPWQTPKALPPPIPYGPEALLRLRSSVLSLVKHLCTTEHGGHTLASHRLAFGRLVRFLHESLLSLYAYRPTHATSSHHVNTSVTILAHLSFAHPSSLDLRARLAVIPQGPQKHLVALSRVAFAEGETALEAGIDADVAEAAHRMLDECLSPEEGEAVMHVFSSAVSASVALEEDRGDETEAATTSGAGTQMEAG